MEESIQASSVIILKERDSSISRHMCKNKELKPKKMEKLKKDDKHGLMEQEVANQISDPHK